MKHMFSLLVLLPLSLFFLLVAGVFVWNMFLLAPLLGKVIIVLGLPVVAILALSGGNTKEVEE